MEDEIRIGIISAGANTRRRHLPVFRSLSKVTVVEVGNRNSRVFETGCRNAWDTGGFRSLARSCLRSRLLACGGKFIRSNSGRRGDGAQDL